MSLNFKEWIPPDRQPPMENEYTAPPHGMSQSRMPPQMLSNLGSQIQPAVEPVGNKQPLDNFRPFQPIQPLVSREKPKVPDIRITKRPHKRTYQSLLNTPRLPPLKKRDGEALWREDIQYDFLHAIFTDKSKVFTNPLQNGEKCTFADIYIDAMAASSKCSRILGEKLTRDRQRGIKIAMVCLLVNWGRMNTTLNFFPEMRTVLRTYHPIPSLQTQNDQDYKQLQDAPRLKSILKGACEGPNEPKNITALEHVNTIPRTNAINLVFLMSNFSQDVELRLIPGSSQFMYSDLIMDVTKSSKSRARAFLWLVWAYMEAPTIGDNSKNPFGAKFPVPETLSPEDIKRENVNTPAELVFGNQMTLQRLAILSTLPNEDYVPPSTNAAGEINSPPQKSEEQELESRKLEVHALNTGLSDEVKEKLPKLTKPLVLYRPKLRSAKDRRLHAQFNEVVSLKRSSYRNRRLKRSNAIGETHKLIKDLDPLYDSDDDTTSVQSYSAVILPGVYATGLGSPNGDYGERSVAAALALKRAAKRTRHHRTPFPSSK